MKQRKITADTSNISTTMSHSYSKREIKLYDKLMHLQIEAARSFNINHIISKEALEIKKCLKKFQKQSSVYSADRYWKYVDDVQTRNFSQEYEQYIQEHTDLQEEEKQDIQKILFKKHFRLGQGGKIYRNMENMPYKRTCFFLGETILSPENMEKANKQLPVYIQQAIEQNCEYFLLHTHDQFNLLASQYVLEQKKNHPSIRIVLCEYMMSSAHSIQFIDCHVILKRAQNNTMPLEFEQCLQHLESEADYFHFHANNTYKHIRKT